MFNWFRKTPEPPPTTKVNPGEGISIRTAFANGQRTWTEETNLIDCMAAALQTRGRKFSQHKSWLALDGGLVIQPRFVELQPQDDGGVQTVTTVECRWDGIIPGGVFEYQHSAGDNTREAITKGFDGWCNLDLPVLEDTRHTPPKECLAMEMDFPATDGQPARNRRVLLGPVSHYASAQRVEARDGSHSFCPCCLFSNISESLKPQVNSDGFHGIRLFALRRSDGKAEADCRVNGEDWPPGIEALIKYVGEWPDCGLEFRKQYAVIQTHQNSHGGSRPPSAQLKTPHS
jgi:hypothetical protein